MSPDEPDVTARTDGRACGPPVPSRRSGASRCRLVTLAGRGRTSRTGVRRASARGLLHELADLASRRRRSAPSARRTSATSCRRPGGPIPRSRTSRTANSNFDGGLEEADDLAVLVVGGHAVPGPRHEVRRQSAVMSLWSRSAMSRSAGGISAIFASRSRSPSARSAFERDSALSSLARSRIAAFSSALNPLRSSSCRSCRSPLFGIR